MLWDTILYKTTCTAIHRFTLLSLTCPIGFKDNVKTLSYSSNLAVCDDMETQKQVANAESICYINQVVDIVFTAFIYPGLG